MVLMGSVRLELIRSYRIGDPGIGLNEPSGLTLNADRTALYTVCDDTKAIFCVDLEGQVLLQQSFFISAAGLEGIALSADGKQLFAVQEETNAVLIIDIAGRCERHQHPLAAMANYDSVAKHFPHRPDNKGLEGITVNTVNQHVFVVKESQPGLLIELDAECRTILSSRCLSKANGFSHPKVGPDKLDFSGLSYDPRSDSLWIVSDQGRCLFQYDWVQDVVLQRLDLEIGEGKRQLVRKAEGVAIDPECGRVYVVSDRDARLYVFKLAAVG